MEERERTSQVRCSFRITKHAEQRMQQRGVSAEQVIGALAYGRRVFAKGAVYFVMGYREVNRCRELGLDFRSAQGVQVVCSHDGSVKTVYRNGEMPRRGRRPRAPRRSRERRHRTR